MDELNLGNAHDVKTYDQLHEILTAFSRQSQVISGHDVLQHLLELVSYNWCGFNTTPYTPALPTQESLTVRFSSAEQAATTKIFDNA